MTRKLSCILLSSAGIVLGLSACNSGDKELPPTKQISSCDSNKVSTGGYIWTYTDAGENTFGTVSPFTTWDESTQSGDPFSVTVSPDENDPSNNSCTITGKKPAGDQPDQLDSCGDMPRYPVAGLGFSFLDKNVPFNVCDKLGIRFRAKGTLVTDAGPQPSLSVRVAFPTMESDIWQPGDKWADSAAGQTCTCDHNKPDGTSKTCFGFYGKDIDVTPTWQWYTVLWGELSYPSWAGETPFDPTHVLKFQWGIESTGDYTLDVDDVQFVIPADGVNWCEQGVAWTGITPETICTGLADPQEESLCNGTGDVGKHY